MTPDAWVRYNKLETQLLQQGLKAERPDIMTPVGDRLAKSILKAALLIAASRQRSDDLYIEEQDILRAIKYGQQWYAHGQEVMKAVGKGSVERQFDVIAGAIAKHPTGVTRSQIMQGYHLTARDADSIFTTLERRGQIHRKRTGRTEMLLPSSALLKERDDNAIS